MLTSVVRRQKIYDDASVNRKNTWMRYGVRSVGPVSSFYQWRIVINRAFKSKKWAFNSWIDERIFGQNVPRSSADCECKNGNCDGVGRHQTVNCGGVSCSLRWIQIGDILTNRSHNKSKKTYLNFTHLKEWALRLPFSMPQPKSFHFVSAFSCSGKTFPICLTEMFNCGCTLTSMKICSPAKRILLDYWILKIMWRRNEGKCL